HGCLRSQHDPDGGSISPGAPGSDGEHHHRYWWAEGDRILHRGAGDIERGIDVQLLSSASRNTSGEQVSLGGYSQITSAVFQLTVSVAAAAAGDTLDVYIQHSVDGGSTYD